jgi:hypothetical protein
VVEYNKEGELNSYIPRVCVYIYIYIYIHNTYIHTYLHTYTHTYGGSCLRKLKQKQLHSECQLVFVIDACLGITALHLMPSGFVYFGEFLVGIAKFKMAFGNFNCMFFKCRISNVICL